MKTRTFLWAWVMTVATISLAPEATGQPPSLPPQAGGQARAVGRSVAHDLSPALRNIPPLPPPRVPRIRELRHPALPGRQPHPKTVAHPVVQSAPGALA